MLGAKYEAKKLFSGDLLVEVFEKYQATALMNIQTIQDLKRGSFAEAVSSRGPAPSKVSVATQVSLGNPGKPLQSSTPRLKLSLPGRSLSAAKAAEAPSHSKDSGVFEAMEVTPLPTPRRSSSEENERAPRSSSEKRTSSPKKPSASGGSTSAGSQCQNGQAVPVRDARTSSGEEWRSRQNSLERSSSSKGQHRAAASGSQGQEQRHSGNITPSTSPASSVGGGRGRGFPSRVADAPKAPGKVSSEEVEAMDEATDQLTPASDHEDMEWQTPNRAMRFPEEHPSEAQTHEFAVTYETTVNGLKEPSPLINLENYDVASGQPCEYMRSVLLGVTKQLTEHLDSTNSAERFDIGEIPGRGRPSGPRTQTLRQALALPAQDTCKDGTFKRDCNDSVRGGTVLNHCNAEDIAVGESLVADLRNGMDIPSTTTINDFARVDNDLELCTESKLTMQLCRKYSRNLLKVSRTRMTTMPTARSHRQ
ncbi:hypothetical protein HPB47_004598 [Ixodes persulcatus]|uniref:Uncharacterized protein n=1 Tax=Ixodes persulcatus TaxID=34615 RepID=A0AC60PFV2_IXOPE|nr:hypothetical protein HPB47_004598 [Ixodes persulcatus]